MSVTARDLRQRQGPPRPEPVSYTEWSGVNMKESRLSVDDAELTFLENAMLLGKHPIAVPLYNGSAGVSLNASSLVKKSWGGKLTYGSFTTPHPVAIVVFEDGSAMMRDYYLDPVAPIDTQVAVAGTFSSSPKGTRITIWQDGPVLIIDDTWGYGSWNGTALTLIDGTKTGHLLAVFEGHVWLVTAPRTLTYTAPNTFNNFVAGDGAGSTKITDEAFEGAITGLISQVEQLWILGVQSVDALGNVATNAGVTTFSVTNAVSGLGTRYGDAVDGYIRSLVFYTGYSLHSLLGLVPQKLSGPIDRLFAALTPLLTFGPGTGLQQLNGITVFCVLLQFTDGSTGATRSEVVCFQEGKFFFARTPDLGGNQIVDLMTLTINNQVEVYGIDRGGFLYRIFARPSDPGKGTVTISTKLYAMGDPTRGHQGIRVGVDLSAPKASGLVPITLIFVSEAQSVSQTVYENFRALTDAPLGLRYALLRRDCPIQGQRLGLTIQYPAQYGVTLEAIHFQHAPTDDFDADDASPVVWNFTDSNGTVFNFTDNNGNTFDFLGSLTG